MKIKQHGQDKKYNITCPKCNSDLEYQECDIFVIQEKESGGLIKTVEHTFKKTEYYKSIYLHTYKCVKCPACNNIIRLDFDKFPELVGWEEIE